MNPSDYVATSAALAVVVHHQRHTPAHGWAAMLTAVSDSSTATSLAAGLTAGAVSRTATAPLDRLKSLAQEGRVGQGVTHASELQRLRYLRRHVWANEGTLAFWRGNGANCLKAGPEYAITLSARQTLASLCRDPKAPSALEQFALGAASGLTAQLIIYPLETTKTRMAVASAGEYTGILDCIAQSLARGGWRDLYRGLGANLAGVIPHRSLEMGMFFSSEQALRRYYGGDNVPLPLVSATGFVASVVSQVVTYPLNLARTKLQTQGVNGRPVRYTGLANCIASVLRQDGAKGLFVGLAPNMLKAAPASSIMYTTYTQTKQYIESYKPHNTQHRAAA